MASSPLHDQPDGTDLLYDVIDHIPAGILVVSLPEFRILSINARACVRLGIRISATITGRLCHDVIPRFKDDHLDELWLSAAGLLVNDAVPATQIGGMPTRRWNAYPILDRDGQAVRLLVVWFEAGETPEHQLASSAQQITRALISTLDRDRLLGLVLEHLHSVVSYDSATIMLRDEDGYYVAASRGLDESGDLIRYRFTRTDPLINRIETAGEPVILHDMAEAVPWRAPINVSQSWIGVPLRAQGDVVGILMLESRLPNRYTRADAARAQAFAAYAALAVRNAELYRRAREQSNRLAFVGKIARTITATHDLRQIFTYLVEHLRSVVPIDAAELALVDQADQRLKLIARHPEIGESGAKGAFYSDQEARLLHRIMEQRQPRVLPLHGVYDHPLVHRLTSADMRSCLIVPIADDDNVPGMLLLASRQPYAFPAIEVRTLADLAQHLAVAIQNARLHQAREQALADLRIAQQRLIQSERLTAVGELVAGVAHELNNPLTAVLGFASLLQQTAPAEMHHDLAMIVEGATRARRIVQNLLAFARQREAHLEEVDLNAAVRQVLGLLAYQMRSHSITVEERLAEPLPTTVADATAIKQVLLNLLNNAQQALATWKGERRIIITTRAEVQDGQQRLVIDVADTGPGILPDHLPLVFEPFFTTKPIGEGTGLGLSICYGIVKQYHGDIRVSSAPGTGACFTVELPVQPLLTERMVKAPQMIAQTPQMHTILVIDDEAPVAELIARLLRDEGFTVDVCRDGAMALERINRTAYDLIVCDVRMPGMSGDELFAELKQRAPHLARRFLFISGDTASRSTRDFLERSGVRHIEKPFESEEFLATVRQCLASLS